MFFIRSGFIKQYCHQQDELGQFFNTFMNNLLQKELGEITVDSTVITFCIGYSQNNYYFLNGVANRMQWSKSGQQIY